MILDGQNVKKKSVSELSMFELLRLEKCMSRLCPSPWEPPPQDTQMGEKHTKRVENMLDIGYFILVNG